MPQKLSGGCACGAIRYECDADPVIMMNCHCRDCQKASGSAYAAIVVVPKGAVQIRGEPRYHKVVAQSGKATQRGFCPNCGSQIILMSERRPDALGLQAGSLDDPSTYQPTQWMYSPPARSRGITWIRRCKSIRTAYRCNCQSSPRLA